MLRKSRVVCYGFFLHIQPLTRRDLNAAIQRISCVARKNAFENPTSSYWAVSCSNEKSVPPQVGQMRNRLAVVFFHIHIDYHPVSKLGKVFWFRFVRRAALRPRHGKSRRTPPLRRGRLFRDGATGPVADVGQPAEKPRIGGPRCGDLRWGGSALCLQNPKNPGALRKVLAESPCRGAARRCAAAFGLDSAQGPSVNGWL